MPGHHDLQGPGQATITPGTNMVAMMRFTVAHTATQLPVTVCYIYTRDSSIVRHTHNHNAVQSSVVCS